MPPAAYLSVVDNEYEEEKWVGPEIPSPPLICRQNKSQVIVSNGSHYPLGSYLVFGNPERKHLGIVEAHLETYASLRLLAERHRNGDWKQVTNSVVMNSEAGLAGQSVWEEYQSSKLFRKFPVGAIRQHSLSQEAPPAAYLPSLEEEAMIIAGQRGSGKSSARINSLVRWRKSFLPHKGVKPPGLLCFDVHGDDLGRVKDNLDQDRPSLVSCLPAEDVLVLTASNFSCRLHDIPAPLVIKCLPKLSQPQTRWSSIYITKNSAHKPIENLIRHEASEWGGDFPELCVKGKMPTNLRESLVALRGQFLALLAPPLFEDVRNPPVTGDSKTARKYSWADVITQLYEGRVVIVDVGDFPESQQSLLVTVLLRGLLFWQLQNQRNKKHLHPIVVSGDEMHLFKIAMYLIEKLYIEARKYRLAPFLGSQELTHFTDSIISNSTGGIVMRSEGKTLDAIVRRWKQAKHHYHEIPEFEPGDGLFLSGGNLALPIHFDEASPV